jgi:hypothetical protein
MCRSPQSPCNALDIKSQLEVTFAILPPEARGKKYDGGDNNVHNCRPDPIVVRTSPTAFHVFGLLSKDLLADAMNPSLPISPIPSKHTIKL